MSSIERRLETASRRAKVTRAFGKCLRQLREQSGLSVDELAAKAGVPVSVVSKAEGGRFDVRVSLIYSIGEGLGISPAAVIEHLAEHVNGPPDDPTTPIPA